MYQSSVYIHVYTCCFPVECNHHASDVVVVLQDMMNRRISMRVLMECALDQRDKQFIFLTPQDMR